MENSKLSVGPMDNGAELRAYRSLLIIDQYESLCRIAVEVGCVIVPLKGIDLLTTLYSRDFDRDVGDIDILVTPVERVEAFVHALRDRGYQMQFNHLLDADTLLAKGKVALRSTYSRLTDVDIHIMPVTKKFFRASVQDFNRDAIERLVADSPGSKRLEWRDRWLFLAQHCVFHRVSDTKWLRDLDLLLRNLSPEDIESLRSHACRYGFDRVSRFIGDHLAGRYPEKGMSRLRRFMLRYSGPKESRRARRRINPFWELLFIDDKGERRRAWRRMFFPSSAGLCAIYRMRHVKVLTPMVLYPFHLLVTGLGTILFLLLYIRS